MATSVREFFEKRVPEALLANPERVKEVAAVYQFKIAGSQGGTWTADLLATPPTCKPGTDGQPQCTIEVSDQDFSAMIEGGVQVAMQILFAGKLRITGDSALITKLIKILQMGA